jgi:mono/diheme cytochrome c family protein
MLLLAMAVSIGSVVLSARQGPKSHEHDARWVSPAREALRANPLANDPQAAVGGTKLFHQRCSTCHGDDAQGTPDAPSLVSARVQRQSDGALFWKISSGNARSGMPTFSFLPPLQRWQLVLSVRAQARAGGSSRVDEKAQH